MHQRLAGIVECDEDSSAMTGLDRARELIAEEKERQIGVLDCVRAELDHDASPQGQGK